jgi:two-component system phosphate regulon sensor histidine kinase PhoR
MLWPIIACLAAAAGIALHFWWRARCRSEVESALRELNQSREERAQASLQARVRQEALFDSMVEGVLVLDETGRIQLANRAVSRLFSLVGEAQGKTLLEVLRLHEMEHVVQYLSREKQLVGYELNLPGPPERSIEINAAAVENAGCRFGTVLVFHDTSRLKQLERTREEFVANVSHELRTPLSLIKGYAETLLDGAIDQPEVARKFVSTIDRNAERLKLLIEDLLTISELESGRVKLALQPAALDSIIGKVFADHHSVAEAKAVELKTESSGIMVSADPGRIEQVLANLVNNAIKYGHRQGRVTVRARDREDGFAEIAVEDNGPGIPEEAIERIFERFYRLDKARSREQGGTGLGLSIAKHIVQSHGGKLWVVSQPGRGATFYFTLPAERLP